MKKERQLPAIQTEKLHLMELVLLKSSVTSTDAYLEDPVKPDKIQMFLRTEPRFDFTNNKCRFRLHITLDGQNAQDVSLGLGAEFMLDYIFIIENLPDFILHHDGDNQIEAILGATLLGISFSTTRGIVMERTKGTPFAGFILPVINPMQALFESNPAPPSPKNAAPKTARKRKPQSMLPTN